eukprot:scaffold89559_cov54-Phaeocystis_antarctica.AAC.2
MAPAAVAAAVAAAVVAAAAVVVAVAVAVAAGRALACAVRGSRLARRRTSQTSARQSELASAGRLKRAQTESCSTWLGTRVGVKVRQGLELGLGLERPGGAKFHATTSSSATRRSSSPGGNQGGVAQSASSHVHPAPASPRKDAHAGGRGRACATTADQNAAS